MKRSACHLSRPCVTVRLYRSTLRLGRAALSCGAGIRELSTSRMHGPDVAIRPVGSYPAFSPLPAGITKIPCGRSFSVTLLYPHGYQVVSLRGALCCPDFPLPASAGSDRAGLPRKGNKIRRIPALRLRFPGIGREYPGWPPWYSRPCRARAPGLCRDAFPPGGRGLPREGGVSPPSRPPPFPCRRIRRCLRRFPPFPFGILRPDAPYAPYGIFFANIG